MNSTESSSRIIKKYPNRRLYDMTKRSYITLHDVKQYVIDQIAFAVIDAESNEDLTQNTLLQIITENENNGGNIFSKEILQNMIRLYDDNMHVIFGEYLQQAMTNFIKTKRNMV